MGITGGSRATKKGKEQKERTKRREALIKESEEKTGVKFGKESFEAESRAFEEKKKRVTEPSPTIKLEPKKTGIAKDIKGAEELLEKGPLGDRTLGGRAGLFLSIVPGALGKIILTGEKVGLATGAKIVKAFQTNAKTIKVSESLVTGVLKQFRKPVVIAAAIGSIIGTYPWAEWAQGEAREVMGFAVVNALKTDNPEIIQEARDAQDELWDQNVWEGLARLIPGANIAIGFWNKYKALRAQAAVNDKIMADRIQQIETGESDDEKWKRVREEEAEADKAAVDYYNEQRKQMVDWENEAELALAEAKQRIFEAGTSRTRAAEIKAREEEAAFWRKEREKQRQLEAEDRKAIADFWLAYRKEALRIANDNRPSNLNFGLL
jgi:hypothetical protein